MHLSYKAFSQKQQKDKRDCYLMKIQNELLRPASSLFFKTTVNIYLNLF